MATRPPTVDALGQRVSPLEHDPELAAAVPERERPLAVRATGGPPQRLRPGRVDASELFGASDAWATFVLRGVLLSEVRVGCSALPELLVRGDVIGPPPVCEGALPVTTELRAVEEATVVVLDARAAAAVGRWPQLLARLEQRKSVQRARALTMGAIATLPNVEARVLATLWHLADVVGRVRPDGAAVRLPSTHQMLGDFVGARRPSVTLAVKRLVEAGVLERLPDGGWLLPPGSHDVLTAMLASDGHLPPPVGRGGRPRAGTAAASGRAADTGRRAGELVDDASAPQAEAEQTPGRAAG